MDTMQNKVLSALLFSDSIEIHVVQSMSPYHMRWVCTIALSKRESDCATLLPYHVEMNELLGILYDN